MTNLHTQFDCDLIAKKKEEELAELREKVKELEEYKADHSTRNFRVVELVEQLTAAQATIAQMREALKEAIPALPKQHPAQTLAEKLVALPTNLDQLHEARARECERLAKAHGVGVMKWLLEEAAAHRAKKEGK